MRKQGISRKEVPSFKKYSKAELIWILEKVCTTYGGSSLTRAAMHDLETKQQIERLNKCDAISKEAAACRARYFEMIKPYDGKPLSEIPRDVLERAAQEIEKAQKLDKEWEHMIKQC